MEKNMGWISVYRRIQNHWLWKDKPFTRGLAWIDMLLHASHKEHDYQWNGKLIKQKRGQFIYSLKEFAEDWGWSQGKVKRFMNLLENEQMVNLKTETKYSIITILNYNKLQVIGFSDSDSNGEQTENTQRTDGEQAVTINKGNTENNGNKGNKGNKNIRHNVTKPLQTVFYYDKNGRLVNERPKE